ncbi:lipopolysaccharide biosynthesis protein WzxC [bacterium BMS3Abin03]|nr:lipopolysaccharide biosynthesis protein WzxC [bacterium BMS3Abin03]
MQLKKDAVKGVKWASASQLGRQVIQYTTTIILAALLTPSDFGVMAMAIVIIGFLDIFKDLGTAAAIIQNQDLTEEALSSIFWVNVGFGILVAVLVFLAAPFGAEFYNNMKVENLLKVLSISFILSSFSIVHKKLLEKELKFDLLAKIELISVILGAVVGISLALLKFGVWSLVFQSLTVAFITTSLLLIVNTWKPLFFFSYGKIKPVVSYSLNLLGYNIFNYFVRNTDYLIIGKFLGERELGHYYLAYKIMLYPLQNISLVVSRVMFPIYSKIQNDNERFKKIYTKVANAISFLTFPLMVSVFALSDLFSITFFNNKWDTALLAILLMILAPVGLIQSVATTTGSIYQAKGRTDWMFRWGAISGVIYVTGFFIGLNWGVIGVAVSYLISSLILLYPVFAIPFKLIELKFLNFSFSFKESFLISIILLIILLSLKLIFINVLNSGILFGVLVILGLIVYALLMKIIGANKFKELFDLFKI